MNPTNPSPALPADDPSEQVSHLQVARLEALQHVALDLTSTLELGDVLKRVAAIAQSLSDYAHAHIFLYDSQSNELTLGANHWANDETPVSLQPRRNGITWSVIQTGTHVFIEDGANHPGYDGILPDQRPGAFACLPLTKGKSILGALSIGYHQPRRFDDETRRFLDLMARYAAIAINNAKMYESATHSATELLRLYDTSLDITSQLDSTKLMDLIIHRAADLLHANSGNFYIYDSQTNELVPFAPYGQHRVQPVQRLKPGQGATGQVFQSGKPLAIEDYDVWESRLPNIPLGRYGRALHVPIKHGEHIIGAMSINRPLTAPPFTDQEVRLLSLFANQAAVALENARLYQVAVEKARMDRELEVALALQASLIPQKNPQIKGWEFQTRWLPARIVSGDFYDFVNVRLAESAGVPPLRFLIGDAADKGMPAALFMALTRSTVRASITSDRSPAESLTHANRLICLDTGNGMFATLCYAHLKPETGELVYVNAGHNPPLWYHRREDRLTEFVSTGPALGLVYGQVYGQRSVQVDTGDFVLFYTDGVTEALNLDGEEFSETRLREAVGKQRYDSAAEIIAALEQSLMAFVGERTPQDDITFLLVKRV